MCVPAVAVAVAPFPIVLVNRQAECRLIVIMLAHMPALAVTVADDLGRGRGGHRRQSTSSDDRGQDQFFHVGFSRLGVEATSSETTQFHGPCSGPGQNPSVD